MMDLSKITKEGKALFLAYDQGMEHGPSDFNDESVDPNNILKIAVDGGFTGVIFQKGVAEKYYTGQLPLILKLNGKTSFIKEEPYAPQICTVEEAITLGASAVGYTIYIGSQEQDKMFSEFANIEREAHAKNIPVIGWMYPRGKEVVENAQTIAYAARVGLEMGADIIKIKYPGDLKSLEWVVKSAGRTKVVVAGGAKSSSEELLEMTKIVMQAGAIGLAIGRNVWQAEEPMVVVEKIKNTIWR